MILSMWHKISKERNVMKKYAAILELDKIHTANQKMLEEAKMLETMLTLDADDRDHKFKDISKRKGLKKVRKRGSPRLRKNGNSKNARMTKSFSQLRKLKLQRQSQKALYTQSHSVRRPKKKQDDWL